MTTQTAIFELPPIYLPAAQEVASAWVYQQLGPHESEELPLAELVDVLETISTLHELGIPDEPIHDDHRKLSRNAVSALRHAAADVRDMSADMAINGYDMRTKGGSSRAAFKKHLAAQASTLLELLP